MFNFQFASQENYSTSHTLLLKYHKKVQENLNEVKAGGGIFLKSILK